MTTTTKEKKARKSKATAFVGMTPFKAYRLLRHLIPTFAERANLNALRVDKDELGRSIAVVSNGHYLVTVQLDGELPVETFNLGGTEPKTVDEFLRLNRDKSWVDWKNVIPGKHTNDTYLRLSTETLRDCLESVRAARQREIATGEAQVEVEKARAKLKLVEALYARAVELERGAETTKLDKDIEVLKKAREDVSVASTSMQLVLTPESDSAEPCLTVHDIFLGPKKALSCPAFVSGPKQKISCDPNYLVDLLKLFRTETVTLRWGDAYAPIAIECEPLPEAAADIRVYLMLMRM